MWLKLILDALVFLSITVNIIGGVVGNKHAAVCNDE